MSSLIVPEPNPKGLCELYCDSPRPAVFEQAGWWPDFLACAECRAEWEARCNQLADCSKNQDWRPFTGQRHAYKAVW